MSPSWRIFFKGKENQYGFISISVGFFSSSAGSLFRKHIMGKTRFSQMGLICLVSAPALPAPGLVPALRWPTGGGVQGAGGPSMH